MRTISLSKLRLVQQLGSSSTDKWERHNHNQDKISHHGSNSSLVKDGSLIHSLHHPRHQRLHCQQAPPLQ